MNDAKAGDGTLKKVGDPDATKAMCCEQLGPKCHYASVSVKCYGYISPGLPVGATHLFSREMLSLAARPASDSSEADNVTTPSQRQADSARFISRLSEPLWCGQIIVCCLIFFEILILSSSLSVAVLVCMIS